ncbi:MAG: hypothetical protein SGBAC_012228 [Bacillariaceae sp.]
MLGFCNCGEDLALAEMFAETVMLEQQETMEVVSSFTKKPTPMPTPIITTTDQREGNSTTRRNVSDYFGEDQAVYETRTIYKEVQDDSWLYDDLRLFNNYYDCKGYNDDENDDDENDILLNKNCELRPLHEQEERHESTTEKVQEATTTDDNLVVGEGAKLRDREPKSVRAAAGARRTMCASDRMELPLLEEKTTKSEASDRDETPYMPVR